MPRLGQEDIGCWVLKTARPPAEMAPGWTAGEVRAFRRCVRRSYRLDLMTPGDPCLLWLSGPRSPGIHALGTVTGAVAEDDDGRPAVPVTFTLLADPVPRAELLVEPALRDAEVLRMPAGSNPSWLSPVEYAAVLARV